MDPKTLKAKQDLAVKYWGAAERDPETRAYCEKMGYLKHLPQPTFPLFPFTTEAAWRAHNQHLAEQRYKAERLAREAAELRRGKERR